MDGLLDLPADLPETLQRACRRFAADHPELAGRDGATDRCGEASSLFCDLLVSMGIPKRAVEVDEVAVVFGTTHRVAVAGGWWIDWTARQFRDDAPWPACAPNATVWEFYPETVPTHSA